MFLGLAALLLAVSGAAPASAVEIFASSTSCVPNASRVPPRTAARAVKGHRVATTTTSNGTVVNVADGVNNTINDADVQRFVSAADYVASSDDYDVARPCSFDESSKFFMMHRSAR